MAIQIEPIKIDPDPLIPGKKVKGCCKVTSDVDIESVRFYDPRDWMLTMYDDGTHGDEVAGDNIYTLEQQVPYDADPGTYYSTIVVTDKEGNVERKTIELRVA